MYKNETVTLRTLLFSPVLAEYKGKARATAQAQAMLLRRSQATLINYKIYNLLKIK